MHDGNKFSITNYEHFVRFFVANKLPGSLILDSHVLEIVVFCGPWANLKLSN